MDQVMSEIFSMTRFLKQALCDQQHTSDKAKTLKEGATKVEESYMKHAENVKVTLEEKKNEFSFKIKVYIQSKEFESLLSKWDSEEAKSLVKEKWQDSEKKIQKEIAKKFDKTLREWEREEYRTIHYEIVQEYAKRLVLVKTCNS